MRLVVSVLGNSQLLSKENTKKLLRCEVLFRKQLKMKYFRARHMFPMLDLDSKHVHHWLVYVSPTCAMASARKK